MNAIVDEKQWTLCTRQTFIYVHVHATALNKEQPEGLGLQPLLVALPLHDTHVVKDQYIDITSQNGVPLV